MQISISRFKLFSDKSVKPHNADMYVLLIKVGPFCPFEITYNETQNVIQFCNIYAYFTLSIFGKY